jgi:c-di-GMP-binding flagellar brake protein YcgR
MDRRERDRVNVRLQCRIERQGESGGSVFNTTENVSHTGMLIRWRDKTAPAVGERFSVKLMLPANPLFGRRWMQFRAQVVRVKRTTDESVMVAVSGTPVRVGSAAFIDEPPHSGYVN